MSATYNDDPSGRWSDQEIAARREVLRACDAAEDAIASMADDTELGYATGEFLGLTSHQYHQELPHFGRSQLVMALRSPAHLKASLEHPKTVTEAMQLGTAIHTAVLEPELMEEEIAFLPGNLNRRTNAGKEEYATFMEEHAGMTILPDASKQLVSDVAAAVRSCPAAQLFLGQGDAIREGSYLWRDEKTGLPLKCRPDLYLPSKKIVVDLKTTTDARPGAFSQSVARLGYHVQAAHYLDGVNAVRGDGAAEQFVFLAVEKDPPYGVLVGALDAEDIERGRDACRRGINRVAWCLENDKWPGYSSRVHRLSLPRWARRSMDEGDD